MTESKPHHTWDASSHVRFSTGINQWCPLSVLNKFDMIWDFCPDMMHLIKTFFTRLVIGVYSGKRTATFTLIEPKKPSSGAPDAERKTYKEARQTYNARKAEYDAEVTAAQECTFSADDQKLVDERVQNLVGYPYWIRASMV